MNAKRFTCVIAILIIIASSCFTGYAADKPQGVTYYFASNGDLDNTGLSATEPLPFEFANKFAFRSNDTILFKRGDTFYGTLKPAVNFESGTFTIGAYGKGALPEFKCVQITKGKWKKEKDGFYSFDLKEPDNHTGVGGTDSDIIRIETKSGKVIGFKCDEKEYCTAEYDYCVDDDCIYMKTDSEPYAKLGVLEFVLNMNGVEISSNYCIKNLRITDCGKSGIDFGTVIPQNIIVSGCEIEDFGNDSGDVTTAGINISNGASNVTIKKNKIMNGYGAAVAVSGYDNSYWHEITIKNNIIYNNLQSLAVNYSGDNEEAGVDGLYFMNNICINQGANIKKDMLENTDGVNTSADILLNGFSNGFAKFAFKGNTFYNSGSNYCTCSINSNIISRFGDIRESFNHFYMQSRDSVIFSMNSPTEEITMTDYSLKDISDEFGREKHSTIEQYDKLKTKESQLLKIVTADNYKANIKFIDNSDIEYEHYTEIADPITFSDILKKYDITVTVSVMLLILITVILLIVIIINRKHRIIYIK